MLDTELPEKSISCLFLTLVDFVFCIVILIFDIYIFIFQPLGAWNRNESDPGDACQHQKHREHHGRCDSEHLVSL